MNVIFASQGYTIKFTLNIVGAKLQATAGRAEMNSLRSLFNISAGENMSLVIQGMTRPIMLASLSVPCFILLRDTRK